MKNTDRIIDAGILDIPTWHNLAKRVLDPEGICTCIHTMGGGISSQRLWNMEQKTIVVGMLDLDGRFESACRVYSTEGIAPAMVTCTGGGITPKIIEYED